MVWIHFCTANHNPEGRKTLSDMSDWFQAGLLDLGHKVTFSDNHLESGAWNMLWDYFTPGFMRELAASGVSYGLVATEIPDGTGFNWRTEPAWKSRFANFNEVAKGASFIWAQVESTVPYYAQFAPTTFTALGFSDRLVPDYIDHPPERDFCFFGLRTPYREAAIGRLRRHAHVEWPDALLSPEAVGQLIAGSRIGISFKQSPQWPVPSPPRLGRLMLAKRGVAAEHVPIATQQGEIAGLCPPDRNFTDYALDLLASDWRKRADETFWAYREQMPMSRIMERALDETLTSTAATGGRWQPSRADTLVAAPESRRINMSREEGAECFGQLGTFSLVHYGGRYIGVPFSLGLVNVEMWDTGTFPFTFDSREELEQSIEVFMEREAQEQQPLRRWRARLARLFS